MVNYDWCVKSIYSGDVELQTYFSTSPNYYFGDPNSSNHEDFTDPKWHLDLPNLSFNIDKHDWTNATKIIGNEKELGAYYRFLVEKAYEYGHSFNTIREYFWMRSSFVSEENNFAVVFHGMIQVQSFQQYSNGLWKENRELIFQTWIRDGN